MLKKSFLAVFGLLAVPWRSQRLKKRMPGVVVGRNHRRAGVCAPRPMRTPMRYVRAGAAPRRMTLLWA